MDNNETRSLILLNEMGDVEISWDSSADEAMREIIQNKMDEGIKFFQIATSGFRVKRTRLKDIDDLARYRINVADEDISKMFETGRIELSRRSDSEAHVTVARLDSAAEVARTNSVGVRQFQGG